MTPSPPPFWILMPVLNGWDYTHAALADCLAQGGLPTPPQVLVIDNGSDDQVRHALDDWSERQPRLHVWHHRPPLPSLAATWNCALRFVWGQGGEVALVVNNDVRLHKETYATLAEVLRPYNALFVSAVGVTVEQYHAACAPDAPPLHEIVWDVPGECLQKGGPDFSCFLITKECHTAYAFDEGFIPAYCEDLDYHRRLLLTHQGSRIFSVNLPYLHLGSMTINQDPTQAARWAKKLEASRRHYRAKWGGEVNQERWARPFDPESEQDGVTTPELQARQREEEDDHGQTED